MVIGAPLGVALGLSGTVAIYFADLGMMSLPTSVYTGIAKYPLLAIPVFVLAGMVFERAGVALRLVNFAIAIVGHRRGGLALAAILVWIYWSAQIFLFGACILRVQSHPKS